jgi:hypothetical protein
LVAFGGLSGRLVLGKSFGCTYFGRFAPFVGALPALFTGRLVFVLVRPALFSDRLASGGRFGLFDVPLLALRAFTRRSAGGAYFPPSLEDRYGNIDLMALAVWAVQHAENEIKDHALETAAVATGGAPPPNVITTVFLILGAMVPGRQGATLKGTSQAHSSSRTQKVAPTPAYLRCHFLDRTTTG